MDRRMSDLHLSRFRDLKELISRTGLLHSILSVPAITAVLSSGCHGTLCSALAASGAHQELAMTRRSSADYPVLPAHGCPPPWLVARNYLRSLRAFGISDMV